MNIKQLRQQIRKQLLRLNLHENDNYTNLLENEEETADRYAETLLQALKYLRQSSNEEEFLQQIEYSCNYVEYEEDNNKYYSTI